MKTKLFALLLLAGSSLFARVHVSVGIGGGGWGYYAPSPVVYYARPPCPGPDYSWVSGYWYHPAGPRYAWHAGYWTRRPYYYTRDYYSRAYGVGPRYFGHRYYRGYWRR